MPLPDFSQQKQQFQDPGWGAEQLRKISLFEGLKEQELFELYQMGKIKNFAEKSNIVIEGQATRGLFILLNGTVSVYKNDRSNNNMIRLAYLDAGAAFGELSLFDDAPRSATVVAESQCILFCLEVKIFEEFLDARGDNVRYRFFRKCAEEMAARFRQQNSDYIISQKLLWSHALRRGEETG